MERDRKSRCWRDGAIGVAGAMLVLLALAYHFDLLEREPYPVMRSELQVDDVDTIRLLPRFQWLDNHRLAVVAFDHRKPMPNGRSYQMDALFVWDIATSSTPKVVEPDVGGLCIRDGQVLYFKRVIDPSGATYRDSQRRVHYRGPLGKGEPIPFKEPTDPKTCAPKSDRSGLPGWTQSIRDPEINLRRLRPEHGFLVIDRDSPTNWPRSIRLYPPGERREQEVDLSRMLGAHQRSPVTMGVYPTWYAHQGAYFVRGFRGGDPHWWLYPDGRLVEAWRIPEGGINYRDRRGTGTYMAPTATFPVQGTTDYDHQFIGSGGLYALADFFNPRRVVKGRIGQELEVSPDGCKVAFANDDRWSIDKDSPRHVFKLQIINLCPEK